MVSDPLRLFMVRLHRDFSEMVGLLAPKSSYVLPKRDKLCKLRRESGLSVPLSVSFSDGTESYFSSDPKPGAADRQKQRRRQRGAEGCKGRAFTQ